MLLVPAPQTFNTFNTFNTFTTFAKFANIDPAPDHPTLIRPSAPPGRHTPLSCLRRAGYPRSGWRVGG
jgi:hypothetical protein